MQSPSLSPDGLTLFFIDSPVFLSPHKAVRASLTAAFSAHAHLELGVMGWSAAVDVRAAGSHLYFIAPPSQSNLALSVTSGENAAISSALALAAGERIGGFSISSDERTLYYQAHEGTSRRVYRSTRTDTSKPFDSGTSLAELSGTDAIVQNLHLGFVTDDECDCTSASLTGGVRRIAMRGTRGRSGSRRAATAVRMSRLLARVVGHLVCELVLVDCSGQLARHLEAVTLVKTKAWGRNDLLGVFVFCERARVVALLLELDGLLGRLSVHVATPTGNGGGY